jgi:hypothetical protein
MCTKKYGKYHVLHIVVQWITSEINEAGKCTCTHDDDDDDDVMKK